LLSKAPEWADTRLADTSIGRTLVRHVPIGVAACITPWNYPLYLAAQKIAPALLAGATVVLKPSEIAPGSIVRLAQALHEAGLPAGALNVVFGKGIEVGETLVTAPQVRVVSFTGSTAVGRRVAQLAGGSLKKVSLELGGKSASLVLPDADLGRAVAATLQKCIQNAGQTCAALTRLLVPQQHFDEACSIAGELASGVRVGNPLDPQTQVGPLINERQQQRALEILRRALDQGVRCLTGGVDRPKDLPRGYYISPTVLATQDSNSEIAQSEAFAPILTVLPYRDEEHAVEIANGTVYGLSGAVWSADESHALAIAGRLRAGSISINGAPTHPDAPFGGFDESGFGRERGPYALDTFMTTQAFNR
jgi:betaine-aldehyde dehydrogenase